MSSKNTDKSVDTDQPVNDHIMLRCPYCDQQYEAKVEVNPLVKDGLLITPLPVEIETVTEVEQ